MYQNPTTTIEHLYSGTPVYKNELLNLLKCDDPYILELLRSRADMVRQEHYGTDVYIRGLIEFTNYCKNNCYYCGIRRDNNNIARYRLAIDDILSCCDEGYRLGFRTFVLQGGEDGYYWSSSPYEGNTYYAYYLLFSSGDRHVNWHYRYYGYTVRPVSE